MIIPDSSLPGGPGRGRSATKPDVSTDIVAVQSSFASMRESHYWPTSDAMGGCSNPTYNCTI